MAQERLCPLDGADARERKASQRWLETAIRLVAATPLSSRAALDAPRFPRSSHPSARERFAGPARPGWQGFSGHLAGVALRWAPRVAKGRTLSLLREQCLLVVIRSR